MAKRKPKASKGEADARPELSDDAKLLKRIRDRFKLMVEADQENRRKALEDLKFVNEPGAQWDANMKKERGKRPCYEFNKLRINGKRVINEIRANRPQGKVRAVEGGDKKTAELYEGLCRNIANISDFDTITDNAAEYVVDAGMGAWRIVTEYADDDVFDQDLLIKTIKNPFCLHVDPACQDIMKRDAEDWILETMISKDAFEARYSDAEPVNFEGIEGLQDVGDWDNGEMVRVVEYWYKEPYEKEIWQVAWPQPDGTTKTRAVDMSADEAAAVRADVEAGIAKQTREPRIAQCHKIMMCIAGGGDKLLEKPSVQAGSTHRFVMVHGESKVVDGKLGWWGLHRFSKDAQQSYNVSRTAIDETIAQAPKSKFWATVEQAKGLEASWAKSHQENMPFNLYNADQKAPGPPARMGGADVPVALMHQAEIASDDIRTTSGLHEESFAEESSAKSGIAIARKQSQAALVTYNFPDNMAKGVRRTWEILIDLIPHIYDAERELRIIGQDGAEDYQTVNQVVIDPQTQKAIRVNDLSTGKYDVTITVGPSFATMRQEAAEVYAQMFPPDSPVYPFVADLVAKASDHPYSEKMAKRLLLAAPPQVQQMEAEGKDIPPEVQAAQAQVEQGMAQAQQFGQMVQQAAQEAEQKTAEAEKAIANLKTEQANLATKQAQFDAHVAEVEARFAEQKAQFAEKQAGANQDGEREALGNELRQAIVHLQQEGAQLEQKSAAFMQQAIATLAEIMQKQQTQVIVPPPRKVKWIEMDQVNGKRRARPIYDGDDEPAVIQ